MGSLGASKQFEFVKGVFVTEADDIEMNHGKRLDTSKYKQFERSWYRAGYPDQEIRDKVSRNRSWTVCNSWSDPANKTMHFKCVCGKEVVERTVTADEVCKDYGWKSFVWSDDGQTIVPVC